MGAPPPHASPAGEVLSALGTSRTTGLSTAEAAARLDRFGPNELAKAPGVPAWKRFIQQLNELVIWILIAAALLSGVLGEWIDAIAILAIVILNAVLGFIQQDRAGRALAALSKLSAPTAKVLRDGAVAIVPARGLVPGDWIQLEAGDRIPADARLVETSSFQTQESALTGESLPVEKDAGLVLDATASLADRRNMVFQSTLALAGKATAVVVATGMCTEVGRIAGILERHEVEPTPLERKLEELGRVLVIACLAIVAVIFTLQMLRGGNLVEVFLLSVSLAVAAVPEGLPAVVTMALAIGLHRMAKRNALVRKLPSVETLGSVTVICSDKTGTLTRNEMTVREVIAGGQTYTVSGSGYSPNGVFSRLRDAATVNPQAEPGLLRALTIGAVCGNAVVRPRADGSGAWEVLGDPTEGALVVAAMKAGAEPPSRREILEEIPFDSGRKAMSVVLRAEGGGEVMFTKGAPEAVVPLCASELRGGEAEPLTDARRREVLGASAEMASRALRVLALAYREGPERGPHGREESGLILAGLAGMMDPPRDEAKDAVRRCREAGIRPVMITGDHPATALAIARELCIAGEDDRAVTGLELDAMEDADLVKQADGIAVYARVTAEHKLRVVQALKSRGHVVAMTGDGVNDAPAVESADIGIAMGLSGSDVTKEASHMVLLDDNFATIISAVEEGRGIFENIQKCVQYLLACNAGEVLLMLVAALLGWPTPLLAVQILWINLVTDGLPALALAVDPAGRHVMLCTPPPAERAVITGRRGVMILLHGLLMMTVTALGFAAVYQGTAENLARARTVAFATSACAQLFYSFACRSTRYTLPELGPLSNPHLFLAIAASTALQVGVVALSCAQPVLGTTAGLGWEWALIFALALTPVSVVEIAKLARARLRTRGGKERT